MTWRITFYALSLVSLGFASAVEWEHMSKFLAIALNIVAVVLASLAREKPGRKKSETPDQ